MHTPPPHGLLAVAIRRPVAVLVGVILVLLFGSLSMARLPIQLTPDVEVPTLTIQTNWPGATPSEVERQVVEPQEDALKSVVGVVKMTAEAQTGRATIDLELRVGSDLQEALVRVNNGLSQVPAYPENVDEPVISTSGSAGPPLAVILIQDKQQGPVGHHRTWADQEVVSQLQRIPGVAAIDFFGGRDKRVEVRFDPASLAARGVRVGELADAIRGQLRDMSGGEMVLGKRRYQVRTRLIPDTPSDLEQVVIKTSASGAPVRVGDVATVRWGLGKPGAYVMGNGYESMALLLRREAGTNVLQVTEEIHARVAELQASHMDREGLDLRVVGDQVGYINAALDLVRQNLVVGGLLASLVLLFFLRSASASLVVATAIPVCVMGTALGMDLMGRTINVVSLAGMAFAVGMVVDNAIVVLENIDTWRKRASEAGVPDLARVRQAALAGTQQVWGAILASTLTTAAVFLPIIAWQDEVGELLRDVAIAVSLTVGLSLVVSVLVIPSFAARLLAGRAPPAESALTRWGVRQRDLILRLVRLVIGGPIRCFLSTAAAVGAAVAIVAILVPPLEYLPNGSRNLLFGVVVPPPGYSVEEMTAIGLEVQEQIVPHLGADPEREARTGVPGIERTFFVASSNRGFMGASAVREEDIGRVVAHVRGVLRGIPGVFGIVNQASLFGNNLSGTRTLEVDITGGTTEGQVAVGGRLMGAISAALPDAQVRPVPGLDAGAPELRLVPLREQASALGLSATELGLAVDSLVEGRKIGEVGLEGEPRLDVILRAIWGQPQPSSIVQAPALGAKAPEELMHAPIATPSGQTVPLSSVASLEEDLAPTVIRRLERRRAITLQITAPEDTPLEAAIQTLRSEVIAPLEGQLPRGVRVDVSGAAGKLDLAKARMVGVLGLAVVISFLLLSALFEDFLAPLVILVTVPLAAAGGVVGLRLVDTFLAPQALDMMTALGFVMLIGIVVNNAILVVDGALDGIREGRALRQATLDAVEARTRPIFMTTLTSMAGLLPLVIFPGNGAELYRGVGAVVLGGLALSTVLTIFIVPALFTLVWHLRGLR